MYFIRIILNGIIIFDYDQHKLYTYTITYYLIFYFSVTLTDSVIVIERYPKDGKYFSFLTQEAQNRPEGASVPALGLSNKFVFSGERISDNRELQPHPNDQYPEVYFTPMTLTGKEVKRSTLIWLIPHLFLIPCFCIDLLWLGLTFDSHL